MNKPEWTQRIVEEVARLEGKKPWKDSQVRFRQGRGWWSSGYAHFRWVGKYHGRTTKTVFDYVSITAGSDEKQRKHLLLHELAHSYNRARSGHNQRFWEKAWGYYEHFRSELDWEAVKKSEFEYKAGAKRVYDRLYPEVEAKQTYGQLSLDILVTV